MKKYFLFACVAAALVSCSSDEFLGENQGLTEKAETGAILFQAGSQKATRANHVGADAAKLLNYKFIVEGSKTTTTPASTSEVFDDYIVKWGQNTAGTTQSNTADWEYVGITAEDPAEIAGNVQTIKYWDYSTNQYDFAAYSLGDATGITVSAIDYTALKTAAYTLKGTTDELAKCYISDLVTAYNPAVAGQPAYQEEVQFTFRNLASKARIAIYETVPGYSVKDVKFYSVDGGATPTDLGTGTSANATLFTTGTTDADKFFAEGTYTVSFPNSGKAVLDGTDQAAKDDYNKAHVSFAETGTTSTTTKSWGALQYGAKHANEKTAGNIWLGVTSNNATFAGTTTDHWLTVLPNETGTVLELRADYTLESEDGSGEEIHVYGAKAFVPANYAAWKSNYAYTYIFKISDATNGWTSKVTTDPQGLYPITFDAVVTDAVDGAEQTTITTVATPSITTYQKGHLYTVDNEYSLATGDIYVQVMKSNGTLAADLDSKGKLYLLSADKTESEVLSALNLQTYSTSGKIIGRNGLTLTEKTTDATVTTIPGVDGNDINVTSKTAAKLTTADAGTYAYVYTVTAADPAHDVVYVEAMKFTADATLTAEDNYYKATFTEHYTTTTAYDAATMGTTKFYALIENEFVEVVGLSDGDDVNGYYTDVVYTTAKTGAVSAGEVYYQKFTKKDGKYAVKVIKVIA